jgi:hypothetical protein
VKDAKRDRSEPEARSQTAAADCSAITPSTSSPRLSRQAEDASFPVRFAPFSRHAATPNSLIAIQAPPAFPSIGATNRTPRFTRARGGKAGFRLRFSSRLKNKWKPSSSLIQLAVHILKIQSASSLRVFRNPLIILLIALCAAGANPAFTEISRLADSVRSASYRQLKDVVITVQDLHGDSVYLETRFTFTSYFFGGKLRYMILFNRDAITRHVPPDGLRAIMAHELAHIDYFQSQSRMGLAGLVRLISPSFNAHFERNADLEAIRLGYGPGLEVYRRWLYRNIPRDSMAEKKRDYFSPEEIEAMLRAQRERPAAMRAFVRCVPRNLTAIEALANHPAMKCPD